MNRVLSAIGDALYGLFPVGRNEWGRFLPMAIMMFLVLANYTMLRNTKDVLVTTMPGANEAVIPYIKLLCTLPAAIVFTLFYSRLASWLSRERTFYVCLVPFIVFFGLFGLVIYPNRDVLNASLETIDSWSAIAPNLQWVFVMVGGWSYTVYYVLAELWGSAILSLFFWQFNNEITKTDTAKRFYPLFGFVGNLGLVVSGTFTKALADSEQAVAVTSSQMQNSLSILMPVVVAGAVLVGVIYWWMSRVSERPDFDLPVRKTKPKKAKMGVAESFKYLLSSRYLVYMAMMVFAYGITINFLDVLWKGQVKTLMTITYPEAGAEAIKNSMLAYMADFSRMTGLIALPLMLAGGLILRHLSWLGAALITPSIQLVAGTGFLAVVAYGYYTGTATHAFEMFGGVWTLVGLAASFGYWQNALTKATKYSVFDATKEMAYFPLDDEMRSKGKAAVDVVGARTGKSGGSVVLTILTLLLPGVALPGFALPLIVVFAIIVVGWFVALVGLNKQYLALRKETERAAEGDQVAA